MKFSFYTGVDESDFPKAGEAFSRRFISNYAQMVQQLGQGLNGQLGLNDNCFGTVLKLPLAHGVPYLVQSPLLKQATPLGVYALNSDNGQTPTVSMTTKVTVNSTATTAPNGYLFVTALYPVLGTVLTDWVSYTPTGTWTTNTAYTGKWRRVGDSMEVRAYLKLTGAPSGALSAVNLPSGFSIDLTKLLASGFTSGSFGRGSMTSAGLGNYIVNCALGSATGVRPVYYGNTATGIQDAGITPTTPGTFANGDSVDLTFAVPIVGWSSAPSLTANVTCFFAAA